MPGVTPGKWERNWAEWRRYERLPALALELVAESAQLDRLHDGSLDMCLVRGEVVRDGLHLVRLYEEIEVAVVSQDHPASVLDELSTADLAEEVDLLAVYPELTPAQAIETAAAGTGYARLPMSVARLHHRKDVVACPLHDLEPIPVGLAWRVERDDDVTQLFVGVVRGRTPRSSR